jgi:hypothetical protein
MATFVPAWKRLGLQLKNEPAQPTAPGKSQAKPPASTHVTKKRKNIEEPAVKNVESAVVQASPGDTPQKRTKITFEDEQSGQDQSAAAPASKPAPTPKSILKKTKQSPAKTPTTPQDTGEADDLELPPPKTKEEKKAKREQRRAKESASAQPDTNSLENPSRPYLEYLKTYHEAQDQWKFNKNHQSHLLTNAFDLHRIPSSFDPAIASYMAGLKGAAARERLGLQARSIMAKALDGDDTASEAYQMQVAERTRAEKIVEALSQGEPAAVTPSSASTTAKPAAQAAPTKKKSRGRKRRSAVEVESSSSDDSSSSDSSSSDED